jgi:hypothetical protein
MECWLDVTPTASRDTVLKLRHLLLLHRSQNTDPLLVAGQVFLGQTLAENAAKAVVIDETPQQGHLLKLHGLDFKAEFLVQPVNLVVNLKGHLFLKTPPSPDPRRRPRPPRPAARRIIVTPFYHTGMKGVDHRYHRYAAL